MTMPWVERGCGSGRLLVALVALTLVSSAPGETAEVRRRTEGVVSDLRHYVSRVVEPAVQEVVAFEEASSSSESCFATPQGRYLRSRCCVFLSNIAGSLLEVGYGSLNPPRGVHVELHDRPPPLSLTYQLMGKWLLPTRDDPLALGVGAEAVSNISSLLAAASKLSGPLGRYTAQIRVQGVQGTLFKCEFGTTHTFLVFTAPGVIEDVFIDVTYRQFLVVPEWMNDATNSAIESNNVLQDFSQWFVGTEADLSALMSLDRMKSVMHLTHSLAGSHAGPTPWANPAEAAKMHMLRHDHLFGIGTGTRHTFCGKPTQAIGLLP